MIAYDFGSGRPDPGSFPVQELIHAASRRLASEGRDLVLYPDPQGYLPLRQIAAARFERREGVPLPVESIVLGTGSMQPIGLVTEMLTKPDDVVITEDYSYMGTLGLLRRYGLRIVGVATDEDGMNPESLEQKLRELQDQQTPARFIYTIATYQNPTGSILSLSRRERLLELAREFLVPVVEDNCYADLHLSAGRPPKALRALPGGDDVLYLASFSKILGPGIRLGYLSAPPPLVQRVLELKRDGGTNALASMIVAEYLKDHMWDHIGKVCKVLRAKRDAVYHGMQEHLGDLCTWSRPEGGMFIWVKMPAEIDLQALARHAEVEGVIYGPGRAFHSRDQDVPYLRLAFGYLKLDDIGPGIERLSRAIRAALPTEPAARRFKQVVD